MIKIPINENFILFLNPDYFKKTIYKTFYDKLKQNLHNKIKELVYNNSKILGICVGMQSLFKSSEEGKEVGFGFFNTNCVKFKKNSSIKIPHIGWNKVIFRKKNFLLEAIEDNYFYFTHSYHINNEIDVK